MESTKAVETLISFIH